MRSEAIVSADFAGKKELLRGRMSGMKSKRPVPDEVVVAMVIGQPWGSHG